MQATANTSPFLCRPSVINERVSGFMSTNASARASRVVISLPETSTMLAAPWASRWVSSAISPPFKNRLLSLNPAPQQASTERYLIRPPGTNGGNALGTSQPRLAERRLIQPAQCKHRHFGRPHPVGETVPAQTRLTEM